MTNEEIFSEKLDIAYSKINQLERERDELRAEATNYLQELAHKDIAVKELRAEVERLKAACEKEFESVQQLNDEVERMKAERDNWRVSSVCRELKAEIETLKAEVKRLKAAMKVAE